MQHVGGVDEIECIVTHPKTGAKSKPNSFVLTVKRPNGRTDTVSMTEVETGVFEGTYEYTEQGPYIYSAAPSEPYKATQPKQQDVGGAYQVSQL